MSLSERDHLVARVYRGLARESAGVRTTRRNGVSDFLEPLARKAGWTTAVGKSEAKRLATEYVAARQNDQFHSDLETMSQEGKTLVNMKAWVDADRRGIPAFLRWNCPMNLRAGLRQKIAFRLGCHELQCSRKRYVKTRKDKCPCCGADESETVQHAMFECIAHDTIRKPFVARCIEKYPPFANLETAGRTRLLLEDHPPPVLHCSSLVFLNSLSASRGRLVGCPDRSGKGLRAPQPS